MSDGEAEFDYVASYEALVEFLYLAPVGIIKFQPEGLIEMANPVAAQLLMPLTTDGDMSDLYRLLSGIAPDLRSHVERYGAETGQICDQMQLVVPGVGTTLMLDINKIDHRTLMAAVQNITDLTQARRQVMQETNSQRLLASVFMGINSPVVVVRTDGFILMANRAFQHLLEYDAQSVAGLNIGALLPPEVTGTARAAQSQQMLTGGSYEVAMQVVSKSGKCSNVIMNSALLREGCYQQFRVITLIPNLAVATLPGGKPNRQPATKDSIGHVQLISLATVKAAIGADWPSMAGRALNLTEKLLKSLLGPTNIVRRGMDDSFIVWFCNSDYERNADIIEQARRGISRLFTTEFGPTIAARIEPALAAEHAVRQVASAPAV